MIERHRPADHKRRASSKLWKALRRLDYETVAAGGAERQAGARSSVTAVMEVGALRGVGRHRVRARAHEPVSRPPSVEISEW